MTRLHRGLVVVPETDFSGSQQDWASGLRGYANPCLQWLGETKIAADSVPTFLLHLRLRPDGSVAFSPQLVVVMTWCWVVADLKKKDTKLYSTPLPRRGPDAKRRKVHTAWPSLLLADALRLAWGAFGQSLVTMCKMKDFPVVADLQDPGDKLLPWVGVPELTNHATGLAQGLLAWAKAVAAVRVYVLYDGVIQHRDVHLSVDPVVPHKRLEPLWFPADDVRRLNVWVSLWTQYTLIRPWAYKTAQGIKQMWHLATRKWWSQCRDNVLYWGRALFFKSGGPEQKQRAVDKSALMCISSPAGEHHMYSTALLATAQILQSQFDVRVVPVLTPDVTFKDLPPIYPSLVQICCGNITTARKTGVSLLVTKNNPIPWVTLPLLSALGVTRVRLVAPLFEILAMKGIVNECFRANLRMDFSKISVALYTLSSTLDATLGKPYTPQRQRRNIALSVLNDALDPKRMGPTYDDAIQRLQSDTYPYAASLPPLNPSFESVLALAQQTTWLPPTPECR